MQAGECMLRHAHTRVACTRPGMWQPERTMTVGRKETGTHPDHGPAGLDDGARGVSRGPSCGFRGDNGGSRVSVAVSAWDSTRSTGDEARTRDPE
eukprot:791052-Rhodomonas_salina.3